MAVVEGLGGNLLHSVDSIFYHHSKHLLASVHKSCILEICFNTVVYVLSLTTGMPMIFSTATILTVEIHCSLNHISWAGYKLAL